MAFKKTPRGVNLRRGATQSGFHNNHRIQLETSLRVVRQRLGFLDSYCIQLDSSVTHALQFLSCHSNDPWHANLSSEVRLWNKRNVVTRFPWQLVSWYKPMFTELWVVTLLIYSMTQLLWLPSNEGFFNWFNFSYTYFLLEADSWVINPSPHEQTR